LARGDHLLRIIINVGEAGKRAAAAGTAVGIEATHFAPVLPVILEELLEELDGRPVTREPVPIKVLMGFPCLGECKWMCV
jgi:hypothetical protein